MERVELLEEFISKNNLVEVPRQALPIDASTRSYQRLVKGDQSLILMNAPPGAEAASCPLNATAEERSALGYNAEARLAGANMHAFVLLAEALRSVGLHAPEVYDFDAKNGFALIEDLGDNIFTQYISERGDEVQLYQAAIDVLLKLHNSSVKPAQSPHFSLLEYDDLALLSEARLLPQWYWPFVRGNALSHELNCEMENLWREVISHLSNPNVLVLRDFHAENLLWLDHEEGLGKVGVIDFQDGLWGHAAYDLVSLLEDARRDVTPTLAESMKRYYCERAYATLSGFNQEQFETDYAILAAQRNAKILGIFARLIVRDGKEKYRAFIPRVKKYFSTDLQHPILQPIREWFEKNLPEVLS